MPEASVQGHVQPQGLGMRVPIPQISPFLETEGAPPVDFRQWVSMLEANFQLLGLQNGQPLTDLQMNLLLYSHLGTRGCKIVLNSPLCRRRDTDTFAAFKKGIQDLFLLRQSSVKALHDFHSRIQSSSEPVDDFYIDLQGLYADCTFPEAVDPDAARDFFLSVQLVEGCYDVKTKQDLLAMTNPTLKDVLQYMRAHETAKSEATAIAAVQSGAISSINKASAGGQGGSSSTPCSGCGSKSHGVQDRKVKCPAYGKKCNTYGKLNHFAAVCRQTSNASHSHGGNDKKHKGGNNQQHHIKSLSQKVTQPIMMRALISRFPGQQGRILDIEADSGADPSMLRLSTVKRLLGKQNFQSQRVQELKNFDGSPITGVLGTCQATVQFGQLSHTDFFHIVEEGNPEVLGKNFLIPLKANIDCGTGQVRKLGTDAPYSKFPRLLSPDLGTFKHGYHRIKLKPGTVPYAVRGPRPIPLCYKEAALEEIRHMDKMGIWEKVTHAEWVHPMVVVGKEEPGKVRITSDLTRLNKAVVPERFPIPRIKDLFLDIKGATVFSKLDLRKGYYHVKLHRDSKDLTTTATPLGLRRYCRLPMGLKDSASVFQRQISQALAGLPGVVVYIDDIIVFGKDDKEHDCNLEAVLKRLEQHDFRLQPFKCIFGKSEIPAFGHILSKNGIRPHPKNVQPILDFPAPSSVKDVQSFLGLINFFGEFISGLAKISEPIRRLTREGVSFNWDDRCQRAMESLKLKVQEALPLHIFDPNKPTVITTDASEVGIGATLTQVDQGKEVPISCFNRTLSPSERNYSATEREAFAVMSALEHWEKLVLGRPVLVRTDHQALISALQHPKDRRQSSKFSRWLDRLKPFNFTVEHIRGTSNTVADSLSRLSTGLSVKSISLSDIQGASAQDPLLDKVKAALEQGWPTGDALLQLRPFKSVAADLSVRDGILLLRDRVFVPQVMRKQVLNELHLGHPGITRFKRSLRLAYWWPGMSADAEQHVKHCVGCLHSEKSRSTQGIPVGTFPVPDTPGQLYNLDIAGPFHNGRYLVVLIDATSNFPEILDTKDITSSKIIKWLKGIWYRVGLPAGLITDNGPQFVSEEFKSFLQSLDIHHHRTPVYYPQENGRVEVFNRSLKQGIQAASAEGLSWEEGVSRVITSYRHTPGPDDKTPLERFLGRSPRRPGTINMLPPLRQVNAVQAIQKRGLFQIGDQVLVRLPHVLKGLSPFSGPVEVKEVLSYFKFRLADNKVYNAPRLKLFKKKTVPTYDSMEDDDERNPPRASTEPEGEHLPRALPRRSSRKNKGVPPQRYGDPVS